MYIKDITDKEEHLWCLYQIVLFAKYSNPKFYVVLFNSALLVAKRMNQNFSEG